MSMIQRHVKNFTQILMALGVVLSLAVEVFAANFVVIANKDVPLDSLSKAELRAIFLGEKVKWDNRKYIKIAFLDEGDVNKEFLQGVVGKTPSQYDNHWQKMVFSGKGAMPQSFAEMSKVVDYVATHPGAVGFVAAGQAGGSVKTISIK
jgi:ABC-type phosphate transport system substrate-binding protein